MARGSRYGVNRLVGPDKITQLEYIDIAKASMYTEAVVPVPSRNISGAVATDVSLGDAVAGSILRIVPNGSLATAAASTLQFRNTIPTINVNVGGIINLHSNSGSLLIVVPPEANAISIATTALTAIEVILDD